MSKKSSISAGFRVAQQMARRGLQNRCTTTVLSRHPGGFPRVSAVSRQRGMRETRDGQRFTVAQWAAHFVRRMFAPLTTPDPRLTHGTAFQAYLASHPDEERRIDVRARAQGVRRGGGR